MTLLLDGSGEVIHGILGAMRFVVTAGATRPFEGPSAQLVNSMAKTFESARDNLSISGPVLERDGIWQTHEGSISELCLALPDKRSRHEAMVASTLCVLMAEDFDPAGERALAVMAEAFEVDQEAARLIKTLSRKSAVVAGGDMFRRFLAERSDESLHTITTRIARAEEPIVTPPEDLEEYVNTLKIAPSGSVGAELLRLYRHTGYDIPGTPGTPPLSVLGVHDLHHVLAGYSTSAPDEAAIAMYVGANDPNGGLYYLAVVLLEWHHNIKVSPMDPGFSALDPDVLAEAAARGALTTSNLSDLSWDWKSLMAENLHDVREHLGIVPGGTVTDGGAWDARGIGDSNP